MCSLLILYIGALQRLTKKTFFFELKILSFYRFVIDSTIIFNSF